MNQELIAEIRAAVSEALSVTTKGYLDAAESAHYLSISVRTFEGQVARELPSHRLTPAGKRLYRREDLDKFMFNRREPPITKRQTDALVDAVVAKVRAK